MGYGAAVTYSLCGLGVSAYSQFRGLYGVLLGMRDYSSCAARRHVLFKKCRHANLEIMSRKISQTEFLEEARTIHGLRYDYSQSIYQGRNINLTITCRKHGPFNQQPSSHIGQKAGCPKCSREVRQGPRISTDEFAVKARAIHGNKYDYSKAVFTGAKQEILIGCPDHGLFKQMAQGHLAGRGCPECGKIVAAKTPRKCYTTERFLESAKKVHGELYDYSLVTFMRSVDEVKIICPKHGVFEQLPYTHLRGAGCQKCVGAKIAKKNVGFTPAAFIAKCQELHPALDFCQTKYINRRLMVSVSCQQHGAMYILPSTLLRGHGCPKCTQAGFAGKATGWTRSKWVARQEGRPAVLYVFKLQGDEEHFYKVGITYMPKQRIAQFPYKTEVVYLFSSQDAASIYNLERTVKAKFKHLRYRPLKSFAGQQECYSSAEDIKQYLQNVCIAE